MLKSMQSPMEKNTSRMNFLGYGVYSAAMNMAMDEAMAAESASTGNSFLRFYDFERPSIILCEFDSIDCLRLDNIDGIDITRRKSGGRPLYLSDNSISYSVSMHLDNADSWANSLHEVHMKFGGLVADAIAKVAGIDRNELTLPRTSSIRFKGRSLAGHAQHLSPGKSLLYQGLIVIEPWDVQAIDRMWHLEREDLDMIAELPSIRSIARRQLGSSDEIKRELIEAITASLSHGNLVGTEKREKDSLLESAETLAKETYANNGWVLSRTPSRVHKAPFCMLWEENQTPKQRQ